MENNSIAIWLWGKVLGFLSWDSHKRCSTFVFEKEFLKTGWEVAPAYDMLFTIDLDGPKYFNRHSLSVGIKTDGITEADLLRFAEENDLSQAEGVVREVSYAIRHWETFAAEAQVPGSWTERIAQNLMSHR